MRRLQSLASIGPAVGHALPPRKNLFRKPCYPRLNHTLLRTGPSFTGPGPVQFARPATSNQVQVRAPVHYRPSLADPRRIHPAATLDCAEHSSRYLMRRSALERAQREEERKRHSRPRLPEGPSVCDTTTSTEVVGLAIVFGGLDGRAGWRETDFTAGRAGGDQ